MLHGVSLAAEVCLRVVGVGVGALTRRLRYGIAAPPLQRDDGTSLRGPCGATGSSLSILQLNMNAVY